MKLDEIVAWYQKKIGTYDKQQWEKTVEQKILDGFSSVTLKNAKLKTELIDVDLVRGSTFPKAKPKQTLITVIRLAILRYLFLPLYAQWWVRQTSPNVFALLLFLYITQMINWAVYTFNIHRLDVNSSIGIINNTATNNTNLHTANDGVVKTAEEHIVSLTELLIPMTLSLLLSLIHSQIVATNSIGGIKPKHRRFSNTGPNGKATREPRIRRRKKLVRMRNQEIGLDAAAVNLLNPTTIQQRKFTTAAIKFNTAVENLSKSTSARVPLETAANTVFNHQNTTNSSKQEAIVTSAAISSRSCEANVDDCANVAATLKLDLNGEVEADNDTSSTNIIIYETLVKNSNQFSNVSKKRTVNWHSPIHNYAIETQEKQQQTSPQTTSSSSSSGTNSEASTPYSGSSSGSIVPANKTAHIENCVQEFYDDLIRQAVLVSTTTATTDPAPATATAQTSLSTVEVQPVALNVKRSIGEDDGFESLNGKSSSGEETNSPALQKPSIVGSGVNQLRLRLNASDLRNLRAEAEVDESDTGYRCKVTQFSESDNDRIRSTCADLVFNQAKKGQQRKKSESTDETDEECGDDGEIISSPASISNNSNYNECTTSATEWLGVTTNSEECSYSSDIDHSDDYKKRTISDDDGYDLDFTPATILNPHGTAADRISCTFWNQREIKKAQMSVLEISSCIIERVESMPETNDYIYIGIFFSFILSLVPSFCRLCEVTIDSDNPSEINYLDVPMLLWEKASFSFLAIFRFAFGHTQWERTVFIIGYIQRLCLTIILFIIFAVAERTFKQRFLYGKLFSHITSSRRARKSNLPHFRLNKVRNIKTWLSVRSYLKKRGPQRSVDIIVSAAFIVTLLLLAFLSVEWLKDSVHLHSHLNLEALMWSTTIGIFLLRFMTLGNKIHHKYRSVSVLITEQINLYLQIEQKPKKKDELMVSNSVLKLAADLLKELESPFKISGLSANPYLFTTIKVVILSALSGVLSEMLGFKLKLHKIKIK